MDQEKHDICFMQLGSRLQHLVSTASSVLFDPDKSGGALQKQAAVLSRALQLGQARPLQGLMHKLRYSLVTLIPVPMLAPRIGC